MAIHKFIRLTGVNYDIFDGIFNFFCLLDHQMETPEDLRTELLFETSRHQLCLELEFDDLKAVKPEWARIVSMKVLRSEYPTFARDNPQITALDWTTFIS